MKSIITQAIHDKMDGEMHHKLTTQELILLIAEARNLIDTARLDIMLSDEVPNREIDYFLKRIDDLSGDSNKLIVELREATEGV